MSSLKRKSVSSDLQRRVRARREPSEDLKEASSEQSEEVLEGSDKSDSSDDDAAASDEENSESESSENEGPDLAASISFGALAKAQATLTKSGDSVKLGKKAPVNGDAWEDNEAAERKAGRKDRRDFNRSSKHAPTEISSKKAVSRKREVVPVPKMAYRDPRFEPTTGLVNEKDVRKAYAFLDDYREDEMKELREKIKTSKDETVKEKMKRTLLSMESKKKAQMRKDKEQEILDKHRKEEKELVRQGKQPFYLKKSEQKKRVLVDQYSNLKGKQLDHAIERRRKKVEGKEKKNLPYARRGMES
ncbi:hypothetical protein BJ878DRAFT_572818 [Calycina marina]|uniref:rRNA biogenesis protein RRP36 n=1 Tax=Calycina marina TaxID=1763456 RepID=A0A9P7ZA09_9HELO|nr:hypothetical protein BJ878DRAFT_572818 [Calycina marina]